MLTTGFNTRPSYPKLALTILIAALYGLASTNAVTIFTADITPDQEVATTPVVSDAYGFATFELNDAQTAFSWEATIFGIDVTGTQTTETGDNLRAAHIHAAPFGSNGGVVWGFFGAPFNDNNPNDFSLTPFLTGVGGVFAGKWDLPEGNNTTLAAQIPNILANGTYINFHTEEYPGGEIRGQIRVPEATGTLSLLGLGMASLWFCQQKRLASPAI